MYCYEDNFQYETTKKNDFIEFLGQRKASGEWVRNNTRVIQFIPSQGPLFGRDERTNAVPEELYFDTVCQGTGLFAQLEDRVIPVRSCALTTIHGRGRISGSALSDLPREELADILNKCYKVTDGVSLIRVADQKISAIHGGDSGEYVPLESDELLQEIISYIAANFPEAEFLSGNYTHNMTSAKWNLGTCKKEIIQKFPDMAKLKKSCLSLTFCTSDTGTHCMMVYPMLRTGNEEIPLTSPLKVLHRGKTTMESVKQQMKLVLPIMNQSLEDLLGLIKIPVKHGLIVLVRVMQQIGIPKRIGIPIAEEYYYNSEKGTTTAFHLYMQICKCIPFYLRRNPDSLGQIRIYDAVAKSLKINWQEYDFPQEIDWKL